MEVRTYLITARDEILDRLRTGPTGDASADENAVENLANYSLHHPGPVTLLFHDQGCVHPLAEARSGQVTLLVDPDDLAADAMHCGPHIVRLDSRGSVVPDGWQAVA